MRLACDTGGTFTDLTVEGATGSLRMFKAPTTPADPVQGVLDALSRAAAGHGESLDDFLRKGEVFIHGTTHAINAIITGNVAKTALLCTFGHPDILVVRTGGRSDPFDHSTAYPDPYISRSLTFQIRERILADGSVMTALDETSVLSAIDSMKRAGVESVAVCLLWSVVRPDHERRIGELLEQYMPGVSYTLSHKLNPAIREYQRASSAAIDASLKPLMRSYMGNLTHRLQSAGFNGKVLVLTSRGAVMHAADVARAPIHCINSGPSMAPIAGQFYAEADTAIRTAIVADTGGTTYDVSVIRDNVIPTTRDMWIGEEYRGHMTGFPSVDVKSIGAGGGSLAWVDQGGLLHVGPKSAGAVPGPACYGKGGTYPTLTDAAVILGYIDPNYFLGGAMRLDAKAAENAVRERVATPLNISVEEAAWAIVDVLTENMVQAIADITVKQGIDPAEAVLIGGGGGAGLNSVFIGRRLGCRQVIVPEVGAALSAAGALMSDLASEYRATCFMSSEHFDGERLNKTLEALEARCKRFVEQSGSASLEQRIEFIVEARYEHQVWEIEVPLPFDRFRTQRDLDALLEAFHATHQRIFAIRDPHSVVELVTWAARVNCKLRTHALARLDVEADRQSSRASTRRVFFSGEGFADVPVLSHSEVPSTETQGPAIIEYPFATIVVDPAARFRQSASGSLMIDP